MIRRFGSFLFLDSESHTPPQRYCVDRCPRIFSLPLKILSSPGVQYMSNGRPLNRERGSFYHNVSPKPLIHENFKLMLIHPGVQLVYKAQTLNQNIFFYHFVSQTRLETHVQVIPTPPLIIDSKP